MRVFVRIFLFSVLLSAPALARYGHRPPESVPLERVIANLEKKTDLDSKVSLARAYSMAATLPSLKGVNTLVLKNALSEEEMVSPPLAAMNPGADQPLVDEKNQAIPATSKPIETATSKAYFEKAIRTYEEVLKKDPKHLLARFGLAWCREKEGKKQDAVDGYRKVLEESLPKTSWSPFGRTMAQEASDALIELLDSKKDQKEIDSIRAKVTEAHKPPRVLSPILIPLEAEKKLSRLIDPKHRVGFSLDGLGDEKKWEWISPRAGWLVFDPKNTGEIVSGRQLFGNVTFWFFFANGFEAMKSLDDDGNGVLENGELKGLSIWRDLNSNGKSETGEVSPVSEWGITKLSLEYESYSSRALFSKRGVLIRGRWMPSYDWYSEGTSL